MGEVKMKTIDWSKKNYNQFKKERRNSLDKFPKTKLELIGDIERFIETNLEKVDIDKNQNRIDWKDDEYIVFQVESMLQDVIIKLQTIKLEDIK
jgi:hypothetical protein